MSTPSNHLSVETVQQWIDDLLWPDPEPRQRARRERILRAATELFVEFGYRKTSVDEIARRAGIAKGTVYLYYSNKAELVCHAIALEERGYLTRMAPWFDPARDPLERIRGLIVDFLLLSREMPLTARLSGSDHELQLALSEMDTSLFSRITEYQFDITRRLLDEATGRVLSAQTLATRTQVLLDMLYAVTLSGALFETMPVEDFAVNVAEILLNGLAHSASRASHTPTVKAAAAMDSPATFGQEVNS